MRANHCSPYAISKFLLSLLLFSLVAQIHGRALPARPSSVAASDGDHGPPVLSSSNPFGEKGRHQPVWNSAIVPGDKGRSPPVWDSTNVPGEGGPWRHAGPGSGVDHQHDAGPGPLIPDNTTKLEKRAINICCFTVPIPSWCFGCGDSTPEPEEPPKNTRDPANYPTMAEIVAKVQAYRTTNWVGKTAIFYSGLSGASAISQALAWCNCHTDQVPVDPGRVYYNTAFAAQDLLEYAMVFSGQDQANNLLPKLFSQAYAEVATGDIYFFTPSDSDPGSNLADPAMIPKTVTWVGWEYPALTRNPGVDNIYRVDPRAQTDSGAPVDNDRKLIWSKARGDGPTAQEPMGLTSIADAVF